MLINVELIIFLHSISGFKMSSGEVNEGWDQQTSCRDVLGNKELEIYLCKAVGFAKSHDLWSQVLLFFVRITVVLCPITTTGSHVWVRGDDQQEKQLFLCPQEVNAAVLASVLSELEGIFQWKRLFFFDWLWSAFDLPNGSAGGITLLLLIWPVEARDSRC